MIYTDRPVTAPFVSYIYEQAMLHKIPINGTFELTPACNFSCSMCYVSKSPKEMKNQNLTPAKVWIERGRQAKEKGLLYLLLTGGEPLLYPDFWEVYEALIQMGILVSVNTNGSLIDEQVLERWKKNPPYRVNITLYGASDATYEAVCKTKNQYEKVRRGIEGLQKLGISVKLNCSLVPQNAADLKEIIAFAKERKLPISTATYMFPPVRKEGSCETYQRFTPKEAAYWYLKRYEYQTDAGQYKAYLEQIQKESVDPLGLDEACLESADGKMKCTAGKASFWITWKGEMIPCGMMTAPKLLMGSRKFEECWEELVRVSEQMSTSGICEQCKDKGICHACAAMAQAETGTTKGVPTYLCHMIAEIKKYKEEA